MHLHQGLFFIAGEAVLPATSKGSAVTHMTALCHKQGSDDCCG